MVHPQRAPVRPRVILPDTGDAVCIEVVFDELALEPRTIIEIVGGSGAGKTTAVEHLADYLRAANGLVILDEPHEKHIRQSSLNSAVIYSSGSRREHLTALSFEIAPWTEDEIVEYLSNSHRSVCASVLRRLQLDRSHKRIGGSPRLWKLILDQMAADEQVFSVRDALQRIIQPWLRMPELGEMTREFATRGSVALFDKLLANPDYRPWLQLLKCRPVMTLVTTRAILEKLGTDAQESINVDPAEDLVEEMAVHVQRDVSLQQLLKSLLDQKSTNLEPLLASVLHAGHIRWTPAPGQYLNRAILRHVQWAGCELKASYFSEANLQAADLRRAMLENAGFRKANLSRASLVGANVKRAKFRDADLAEADLSYAVASGADFGKANLTDACLEEARLRHAIFIGANLTRARFAGANLSRATIVEANLEETDFTDAEFLGANLQSAQLQRCVLKGASFARANMRDCDLEFQDLPGANFRFANLADALLTGTNMRGACFYRAALVGAKMADIDWEGVDLRGADMRGCIFHMGSSRSGLVGSPYPGHGSKTGFYTDPFDDRYHKSPEEIRKGNLRGADLRGARIDGVDFYLMDLRGAKYDPQQAVHLRSCNAILDEVG